MAENSDLWNVHPLVSIRPQNVSDVTSLSSNNILDSSYKKADHMNGELLDHTSEVRKNKLGDRITTLHQLVCPFGKTDTASVFMEAIGYIRFLHGQIEALSYPHLGSGSENVWNQQYDAKDKPKDLRSRGLCLVPVSFTQPFGKSENAAD